MLYVNAHHENFLVLGDKITAVLWKSELASARSERCQEIVVDEVITTECHEDQCMAH